jgi:diadenosine tetraphosphate (Ap4A) HIT family hydrolase
MSSTSKINSVEDVLAWDLFSKGSKKRNKNVPKVSTLDNRLILETKNLFVVAGLGCFVPGYFLIITKSPYTSFSQLNDYEFEEYNWLVDILSNKIRVIYEKNTAIFEHGMCACAGGLDHAHVHVMPAPSNGIEKIFDQSVNNVLKKRAAGINKIEFKNNIFNNVHDISTIINFNDSYKIIDGSLLRIENLKESKISFEDKRNELLIKQQYINFSLYKKNLGFCTDHYLGTQFGREMVYELYSQSDEKIKDEFNQLLRSNPTKLIWRWQDYIFENNIIKTMSDFSLNVKKFFNEKDSSKYNFVNHVIKK